MEPDFLFKKDLKFEFGTNADFLEFINKNSIFFDKTLMIKDILEGKMNTVKIQIIFKRFIFFQPCLITRPHRWGKTLNISMVESFFDMNSELEQKKKIFADLKIGWSLSQTNEFKSCYLFRFQRNG